MQSCKWLEPKHVMKNDSHARVVRSVIKTAGNKVMVTGANIVNSNKENNWEWMKLNSLRSNLGISGSQKLRYLSSKTCPIRSYDKGNRG